MPSAPASLVESAPFVKAMEPALKRSTALLGGTDAMRQARTDYLPKFPGEPEETYNNRVAGAVLNNFYEAMAGQMAGMMCAKPVTWVKPSKIDKDILANLNKRGADINAMASELAKALLTKGRPHILVDHPKRPDGAETRADDLALGLRPYWVMLEPASVFNAWADTENGDERLGDIRWREYGARRAADGYGLVNVERIRVLKRTAEGVMFEKWEREGDPDQFELMETGFLRVGAGALQDIPLETCYAERQSFMVAKPTLDDIAHKNIEHWQSSADQRHILTVTRFPILYQLGVKQAVALVGPYSMFHTDSTKDQAEIGYAEAEGTGMEHGWKDLDRIMREAESMAVRIVVSDAAKTDAGEKVDFTKEGSRLQKLAVEVQRGLNQALIHTARWLGLPDEAAGQIETDKDFGLSSDDAKAIEQLLALREKRDLSQPTLWSECVERGLFKGKFDAKKEQELLEEESQRSLEQQMAFGLTGAKDDEDEEEAEEGGAAQSAAA